MVSVSLINCIIEQDGWIHGLTSCMLILHMVQDVILVLSKTNKFNEIPDWDIMNSSHQNNAHELHIYGVLYVAGVSLQSSTGVQQCNIWHAEC